MDASVKRGHRIFSIFTCIVMLFCLFASPVSEKKAEAAAGGTFNQEYAYEVLELVNQQRTAAGLSPLSMDQDLLNAAMLRATEIAVYFAHIRPDGSTCYTADPSGKMYGENIAYGYSSPDRVMDGWMNSSGHRANIMNSNFRSIGIACYNIGGVLYWTQCFGYDEATEPKDTTSGNSLISKGIYVSENDTTIVAGLVTVSNDPEKIEYRWMACDENDQQWFEISGWTKGYEWVSWTPEKTGNYILVAQARVEGDESTQVEASAGVNYHKYIKGVCQMPNPDGAGYLIGLESYDNPNHELKYEMLILDCTLYRDGLPAWIYQTGQCNVPDQCFWTIWQPEYGYYWTLFRVYDKNGTLLDEVCYGFVNAY